MPELLGNIERQDVISQGAQAGVSPGYVKSAFSELAAGLDALATPLVQQQQQKQGAEAQIEGQNAVYRDTNGNLTFNPRPLDRTGIQYNNAAMTAYLAQQRAETLVQMAKGEASSNGNIASFDTWYKGYRSQMLKGKPPIMAGPLTTTLDEAYNHQREGMIRRQTAIDLDAQKKSILDSISLDNDDMTSLAGANGTGTPEFKAKQADLKAQFKALTDNPVFGFPQAQADVMLRKFEQQHTGEAFIGQVQRTYEKDGLKAAEDFIKTIDDPSLPLDPAARRKYQNIAEGALKQARAEQAEVYKGYLQTAKDMEASSAAGIPQAPEQAQALIQKLRETGGINGAIESMNLERHLEFDKFTQSYGPLSPEEHTRVLRQFRTGGQGGAPAAGASGYGTINAPYNAPLEQKGEKGIVSPAEHFSYLKSIGASTNEALMLTGAAANESSFNATAVHDQGHGYGLYGHNSARLDLRGQSWQQQATAALQELRRRPESAIVNAAKSPEDLALAEMHYEAPRGYSADNPRAGDNYTGRLNTLRYFSQMASGVMSGAQGAITGAPRTGVPGSDVTMSFAGGGGGAGGGGAAGGPGAGLSAPGFDAAAYGAGGGGEAGGGYQEPGISPEIYRYAMKTVGDDTLKQWELMKQGIMRGEPPTDSDWAQLGQNLQLINNPKLTAEVRSFIESGAVDAPHESLAALNAGIADMEKNGVTAMNREAYQSLINTRDKTIEAMKPGGDLYQLGISRGNVQPPHTLDFSTPDATALAINDRVRGARTLESYYGSGAISAFTKTDAAAFKGAIQPGNPGAGNAFGSITALPDDQMVKTLAMDDVKGAISGALQSKDYGLYSGAMQMLGEAYGRQPAQVAAIMGKNAIDAVQDWDGRYRYYSQAEMQDHFKRMDDPAFAKQYEAAHADGLQIARSEAVKSFSGATVGGRVSVPDIVTALTDTSVAGRLLSGAPTPQAPIDPTALNSLRQDYETIYAERYATLQDRDLANTQTMERLKTVWGFSPAGGNRLMAYPPEAFAFNRNGSKDWMKPQIENELIARGFTEGTRAPPGATMSFAPQGPTVGVHGEQAPPKPWDYSIVTDRKTELEVGRGARPSYQIIVQNPGANNGMGGSELVKDGLGRPLRFQFDETAVPIDYGGYQTRRGSLSRLPEAGSLGELPGAGLPAEGPAGPPPEGAPAGPEAGAGAPAAEVPSADQAAVPSRIAPVHARPASGESRTLEPVTGKELRLRPKQQQLIPTFGDKSDLQGG